MNELDSVAIFFLLWFLPFVLITLYGLFVKILFVGKNRNDNVSYLPRLPLPLIMTESEIKKIDKKLDVDKFMKNAFKIFSEYESAIQNYDYEVLESILGHDLKILKIEQVQQLEEKGIQKITNNLVNIGGGIIHIYKYGPIEKIDVLLTVHRSTYYIDKKSKNIINGYKDEVERVTYRLTFESTLNGYPSNCPSCGASIDVDDKSKCKYCNNLIQNNYGDFNLIFKETLRIDSVIK